MSVWSSDVCSSDLVLLICDPVDDRPRSSATATLMSKTLMPRIDVQAENQRMDNIHAGSCLCGAVHYQVDGAFEQFYLCHCRHCRKDTRSAHAANLFSSHAASQ